MVELYPGKTVIIPDNNLLLFGTITDVEYLSDGDILLEVAFKSRTSFGAWVIYGPEITVLEVNPYSLPQLINMALDTGNREDFHKYVKYLKDWEMLMDAFEGQLFGYTHREEKAI